MLMKLLGKKITPSRVKSSKNHRPKRRARLSPFLELLEDRKCPAIGLWQGTLGTGDLQGSGGGLSITSTSGNISAVIDTSGNAQSFSLGGTGTGVINISGVNCTGSGFALSSSGTVQNLSISSTFTGSGQGNCPPPVSGSGSVNYSGPLTGSLNAGYTQASGTWTATWDGNFGRSGTMNGTWTSNGQLANDLVASGLTWVSRTSDVQFAFRLDGANIPVVSSYQITLHWATESSLNAAIGTAASVVVTDTQIGSYQKTIPVGDLSPIPAGATHLLAVLDSLDAVLESRADNNLAAITMPPVTGGNNPPDAMDDPITLLEDTLATSIDVLTNDTAAPDEGETLSVSSVTQPLHGVAAVSDGGGGVTYRPNGDFVGDDSFTYTISDGRGGSDTATVNVSVTPLNDPPDAVDDTTDLLPDSPATLIDVLANDRFSPDTAEVLTVTEVTQSAHGTVAVANGGAGVSYQPTAGFNGIDNFTYTISDGNGGTDTATVTVSVGAPGVLQFSAAQFRVAESAGSVILTVTRASGSSGRVSANYSTGQSTGPNRATPSTDFGVRVGSVIFEDGDMQPRSISISIKSDTIAENDETFPVTLRAPTGGATLGEITTATVIITEPGTLSLDANAYTVAEDAGSVVITVKRTSGSGGDITATVRTIPGPPAAGQATAGVDYSTVTKSVTFGDGDTEPKTVLIPIMQDAIDEQNEKLNVALSSSTAGVIVGTPKSATVTITNVTPASSGTLSFTKDSFSVSENGGSVDILVSRTSGSDGSVSVSYATSVNCPPSGPIRPGTARSEKAKAEEDFTSASGTISFASGDTQSKTIRVSIIDDTKLENDEVFCVILNNPTGGAVLGTNKKANVTIRDFEPGRIEGLAFQEFVVDGKYYHPARPSPNDDEVEWPVQNGTVFLDRNGNKQVDEGETTRTLDATGRYAFADVAPGRHSVCLDPASSSLETVCKSVKVDKGETRRGILLGTYVLGNIYGRVTIGFRLSDIPQEGATIIGDANQNGRWEEGEPKAVTNSNGTFVLRGVIPGVEYLVFQVVPTGFVQKDPPLNMGYTVTVQIGGGSEGPVPFRNRLK